MSLPYFQFYPKDWLPGTAHLTDAEKGAFIDLLSHLWMTDDCTLPDDDRHIARLLKMPLARWMKLKGKLTTGPGAVLVLEGGRIFNNKLRAEYKKACEKSKNNSRAASTKYQNLRTKEAAFAEQSQSVRTPKPDNRLENIASYGQAGSINPNGSGFGNSNGNGQGAIRLNDFHLTPEREAWAVAHGFKWGRQELERELAKLLQRRRDEGQHTISDTNWQRWVEQAVTYRNKHDALHPAATSTPTPTTQCEYGGCSTYAAPGGRYCRTHGKDGDYRELLPVYALPSAITTPRQSAGFQAVGEVLRGKKWATATAPTTPTPTPASASSSTELPRCMYGRENGGPGKCINYPANGGCYCTRHGTQESGYTGLDAYWAGLLLKEALASPSSPANPKESDPLEDDGG